MIKLSKDETSKKLKDNPMLKPKIEKVTVNISVGNSGEPLERAMTILKELTKQQPCKRKAKKTIRDFGISKGESIACLVTLRRQRAIDFLKKAFLARDSKLSKDSFDQYGNFSFGIREHIEIPETRYVPELGIIGMDVSVALGRPGYCVKNRRRAKSRIGADHLLSKDEAIQFIQGEFEVKIE